MMSSFFKKQGEGRKAKGEHVLFLPFAVNL